MLSIASWLDKYENSLKAFVADDRIQAGIKVLINIYITRSQDSSVELLQGIINFERENKNISTS